MTRIVAACDQLHLPAMASAPLALERCSSSTAAYAAIYSRHYTRSRGMIGRQLHYLVWVDGRVAGIIAAGEPMFRNRARDRFYGLTYASPAEPPPDGSWPAPRSASRKRAWPCIARVAGHGQEHGAREVGDMTLLDEPDDLVVMRKIMEARDSLASALREVTAERDRLRAEVERLKEASAAHVEDLIDAGEVLVERDRLRQQRDRLLEAARAMRYIDVRFVDKRLTGAVIALRKIAEAVEREEADR